MEFLSLKKDIIESQFNRLNKEQKEACFNITGPLLILAGAGSGKTTVIVNRISYMIKYGDAINSQNIPSDLSENDIELMKKSIGKPYNELDERVLYLLKENPISPYNILAITFTNKAASEMRQRLILEFGEAISDMWVSTFHSACVKILRYEIENIGYSKNFIIYDTTDQKTVIKDCLKELSLNETNFPIKQVMSVMGKLKDNLTTPKEFLESSGNDYRLSKIAKIYELYQKKLKNANALDFDDIIMNVVILFRDNKAVLEKWQKKFKYIMVDEYQDTNFAQYMLVSLLASSHKNICVVGDDDQSIYKFRGANVQNILDFEKHFSDAKVIMLEQNYRSTQNILDAANNVIKNNFGRNNKNLWTQNGQGEKIFSYNADSEQYEAYFIANEIEKIINNESLKFSDFAVLYRMNAQTRVLEQVFTKAGIPYRIHSGLKYFDRKEIKDIVAYLRVVQNEKDNISLKRIINEPKRGIGKSTIEKAELIANLNDLSIFEVVENASKYPEISKFSSKLNEFCSIINGIKSVLNSIELDKLVEKIIADSLYVTALEIENSVEARGRIENILEFLSLTKEFMKDNENASLEGFLENISLMSDIDNYDETEDAVVLMTLHSAKGLEFPVVFLCGMEEGVFPSYMSAVDEEELSEERRLCYVGITRAKKRLYISHSKERTLFGKTTSNSISRFIREIPFSLMENLSESNKNYNSFDDKKQTPNYSLQSNTITLSKDVNFNTGDMVFHKKFGKGMVISAKQVGNDCKLEIAFDNVGTKNLMAAYANLTRCEVD